MRIWYLSLAFCVILTGCVTQEYDSEGNPVGKDALETDLVVDDAGRIIARPTRLIPPDRMIVNGDTPTEREIRLLGVEGLPESDAPTTYAMTQEWLRRWVAEEDEVFVKPAVNAELDADVIYGIVYLRAKDPDTGELIPDGYVNMNMAMLSQGLVRIRDLREIEDERLRARMKEAEELARREKHGLWSSDP